MNWRGDLPEDLPGDPDPRPNVGVGPRIEVPFPVMTDAGFPWGLRCDSCSRLITEGQPYREDVEAVYENGDTLSTLRCVYCPAREVTEETP